jgi:uncharacterized protein YjiS (DUF1127 family)
MLVMTFATKSFASVSSGVTRVAAWTFYGVATLTKAIINRREVLRLSELDERGLKDIGLVRSDVEGALSTSWLDDPSTILAARSRARSGVAAARRDEASKQARVTVPVRPSEPAAKTTIACSA